MRFARYQAIEDLGIAGKRSLRERTRLYRVADFKGATVLDLGCNIGQMMYQALQWGAKEVVGVEINRRFAQSTRRLLECRVIEGDLDYRKIWDRIPRCDVVFLLALVHWVRDPVKLVRRASDKTGRVMYFEGHPKEFIPDNYRRALFPHTKFSKIERLGETPPARPFFRLSFERRGTLRAPRAHHGR